LLKPAVDPEKGPAVGSALVTQFGAPLHTYS
jgi:hypothetical protein